KRPVAFAEDCIGERAAAAVNAMKSRATSCAWRTPGSTRARSATIPVSSRRWPRSATSSSTTPSRWRTAPPLAKVDTLIIGGGMANTLLAACGYSVGKSLCEHDLLPTAREIMAKAKAKGRELVLPVDAVVAKTFAANAPSRVIAVVEVAEAAAELTTAGKIVTVAGGGDTVAAVNAADRGRRLPRMAGGQAFAGGRGAQGQITVAFLPSAHGGWSAMKKGAPENQQQCGVDSPRTSRKTIRSFKSRCMAA